MYRVTYEGSKPNRSRGSRTAYWYDEIRSANVLPSSPQNAHTIYAMGETEIPFPTSRRDVGNIKPRKGKALKGITPRSKSGGCIQAVFVDGNERWVPA